MEDKGDPWLWEGVQLSQELANVLAAQTKPLGPAGLNQPIQGIVSEGLDGEDLCKGADLDPSFYQSISRLTGVGEPLLAEAINILRERSAQYQHWRNELFRQDGDPTTQADPVDALKSHSLEQLPQLDAVQAEQPHVTLRDVGHKGKRTQQGARYLDATAVGEILDKAIDKMKARWAEKYKPREERRARKTWEGKRGGASRMIRRDKAQRDVLRFERYIANMCDVIKDMRWTTEAEVEIQALSLEQTVKNREEAAWRLALLCQRARPPRRARNTRLIRP